MDGDGVRQSNIQNEIIRAVRKSPGIVFEQIYQLIGVDACSLSYLKNRLQWMRGEKLVDVVWDLSEQRYRYYLYGRAPKKIPGRSFGCWRDCHPMNKARGERFMMEFDEAFGLLYCELKILAGAVVNLEASDGRSTLC